MTERVRISVCMATYNGALYLHQQIESILEQLQDNDELVVIDDASTDESATIVESYRDPRIRLMINGLNVGHVSSFERAMAAATGEIIMLSDQDDIWAEGRVDYLVHELEGASMVASNYDHLPPASQARPEGRLTSSSSAVGNLLGLALGRRPYYGCTMAFTRDFVTLALPFPPSTRAHDHWLAILGTTSRSLKHASKTTVHRRLHDENLSPRSRRTLGPVLRTRILMASHVLSALLRTAKRSLSKARRERG
jgi:glycosyltransferase involved in cell wall biosynthesis